MSVRAAIANSAWGLSCLPAWWSFRRALACPEKIQRTILHCLLKRSTDTAFGHEHGFGHISDYREFISRVPIREYAELEPWIDRIRRGEQNVLTSGRVTRLAPTSGTSGGRKLIPYTKQLQREFSVAVAPWIVDLFLADPRLMSGSAYWSISPVVRGEQREDSAVPIGYEDDTEYLGGMRKKLIDWVMAVPSSIRHATSMEEFRRITLDYLEKRRDLRLISIWHPSFLSLLLGDTPSRPENNWPGLRLISCWADGQGAAPAEELSRRFAGVTFQPKGLIATEAIVSIPFRGQHPLAITSHFLEFIDEYGQIRLTHELSVGKQYAVVVTTGGGLWRYRLNDVVCVDGLVRNTPSVRFVGKAGNVSDLFGEKLSESFVSQVLERLRAGRQLDGSFAMLAPEGNSYVFYVQGMTAPGALHSLDQMLRENPQYGYCRDLGQLAPPRLFKIDDDSDGHTVVLMRLNVEGQRLGDIKPAALSRLADWHSYFRGRFAS